MQKNKYIIISLGTIFLLAGLAISLWLTENNYTTTKKLLRFNYVVKNESENFIANSSFIAAIPMQVEGIQFIESINSSYEHHLSNINKHSIEFPLKNIAPYSSKIIDLTLVVALTNKPKSDSAKSTEYLQNQKYTEVDSPEIKELAAQLKGKTNIETAKNIHQWLVNNITLSSYTADNKGAVYLLRNRTGDCTEFMYSFIALARANGIPARGISGFWIPGESSLINAADYHDWAEFYDGDQWVLVDASKNVFDENHGDYISLHVINDQRPFPRYGSDSQNLTISNMK